MNTHITSTETGRTIPRTILSCIVATVIMFLFITNNSRCWASQHRTTDQKQSRSGAFQEKIIIVTAYCKNKCCCEKEASHPLFGITASGHRITEGEKFCAAPRGIPFGTWINIPIYGRVQVMDRGGAIKGNRLDVYFGSHEDALQWGRKRLKVVIKK